MTTIGFIGSGHIGSQLARLAVAQGYDVVMSNSRGPETLADLVTELGSHARAATPAEAAAASFSFSASLFPPQPATASSALAASTPMTILNMFPLA